jgi:hypothetical protein
MHSFDHVAVAVQGEAPSGNSRADLAKPLPHSATDSLVAKNAGPPTCGCHVIEMITEWYGTWRKSIIVLSEKPLWMKQPLTLFEIIHVILCGLLLIFNLKIVRHLHLCNQFLFLVFVCDEHNFCNCSCFRCIAATEFHLILIDIMSEARHVASQSVHTC